MFYFVVDFEITDYADDLTRFSVKLDRRSLVVELEISSLILFSWLKIKSINVNLDKSHLLSLVNNTLTYTIDGKIIESEENQVLLGVTW